MEDSTTSLSFARYIQSQVGNCSKMFLSVQGVGLGTTFLSKIPHRALRSHVPQEQQTTLGDCAYFKSNACKGERRKLERTD